MTLDFARKKVAQALLMSDGRMLVIRLKKSNTVMIRDLETGAEKIIYEGEEEPKL